MGRINILDRSVSEKIAAGEVVERPSSVVKELIENSFDAGATSVTAEIEKGGVSYIRVTDNGSGILKEDVASAFLRHATSKIKTENDLEKISSLGFRGEALCSISAVSRTELITRTVSEEMGTYMAVEGGETVEYSDAGCPTGTTVTVRNLFFNTPARMKFLKRDAQEAAYVTDICQRAALSHPEVSFRYIRDGKDIFFTPGDNVLQNTVRAIFGKDISNALIPVKRQEGCYLISGLTGANRLSRPNRSMQFFFVNGRLVKSAVMSLAVTEGYKNELMAGKFPVCMIDVSMPPQLVDVNVHPAKTEVKFSSDEDIYRALALAVREALSLSSGPREVLLGNEKSFKLPVESHKAPQEKLTFKSQEKSLFTPLKPEEKKTESSEKALFTPIKRSPEPEKKTVSAPEELPVKKVESLNVSEEYIPEQKEHEGKIADFEAVGQIFSTYIILQKDDSMILIDQHAAHERLIYERIKNEGAMKQVLMLPITVPLSPKEKAVWEENREFLAKTGFETDDFGQNSIIVRTLPSDIDYDDGEALVIEVISDLMGSGKGELQQRRDRAVYTVSCRAAIKANKSLSEAEMRSLAQRALSMEGISTCPHGRPISVKLTKYQIEKMFKRIV